MRGTRFLIGVFAIGATLGSLSACSHSGFEAGGDVMPANMIAVQVRNDHFLDMDVYAVSEGLSTRLGTVTGTSSRTFVVDPSFATRDFRIVATPIGGNGRASTGSIVVAAGQTVEFTIGSNLRNSTVFIK